MSFLRKLHYRLTGRVYADTARFKSCGRGVELAPNAEIYFPEHVEVGDYCYIGPNACWYAEGGIRIGRGVIFGPRTAIWTTNHDWRTGDCLPYGMGNILRTVTIGDYVWVAFGVSILPGVTIGEGAILAMGSVVTKDVEPLTVVGGNPAKPIDQRDPAHFAKLKEQDIIQVRQKYLSERTYWRG